MDIAINNQNIELTHPEKVLFPKSGITKADLIDYYRRVAGVALRHLKDRPLVMERYTDGIGKEGFFQRERPDYFPSWIDSVALDTADGKVTEVVANDAATILYLANQDCITLHAGLSRRDRLQYPDRLIFDLDPSNDDFGAVQSAARMFKEVLDELGITSFVQITGSRGLHVVAPLDRSEKFDTVREFARAMGEMLARLHPEELTVEQRKDKRGSRIFLDYLRNAHAQTAVVPYSVRAREGATTATPLEWPEALASGLSPRQYDIKSVLNRLAQKDDPWARIDRHAQSLKGAREKLDSMIAASKRDD